MNLVRRIATSLLVIVLGLAVTVTAGTTFRCRFDGTVRAACCCSPPANQPVQQVSAACCCDVQSIASVLPESTIDGGPQLVTLPPVLIVVVAAVPAPIDVLASDVDPVGRAGPSLLLVKHSRLI
jgi:hypothetical protein